MSSFPRSLKSGPRGSAGAWARPCGANPALTSNWDNIPFTAGEVHVGGQSKLTTDATRLQIFSFRFPVDTRALF